MANFVAQSVCGSVGRPRNMKEDGMHDEQAICIANKMFKK